MAEVPSTRQQWRAWIRSAGPGEVRRRARVRQDELARRIGDASGVPVSAGTLSGWERGSTLPRLEAHAAAWHEAVAEMAAAQRPGC